MVKKSNAAKKPRRIFRFMVKFEVECKAEDSYLVTVSSKGVGSEGNPGLTPERACVGAILRLFDTDVFGRFMMAQRAKFANEPRDTAEVECVGPSEHPEQN